jgi:hypothetical protein
MKIDRLVCDFDYKCRVCSHEWRACCVLAEVQSDETIRKRKVQTRIKYTRDHACPRCKTVAGEVVGLHTNTLEWC